MDHRHIRDLFRYLQRIEGTQADIRTQLGRLENNQLRCITELEEMKAKVNIFFTTAASTSDSTAEASPLAVRIPAAVRVINTVELLEKILWLLDEGEVPRTLLLAQRVSRQFKAVIDGSIKLQQELFFSPGPEDQRARVNKLLLNDQRSVINLSRTPGKKEYRYLPESCRAGIYHCQLFLDNTKSHEESQLAVLITAERLACFTEPGSPCLICKWDCRLGGSWKRMYLSQPPRDLLFRAGPYSDAVIIDMSRGGRAHEIFGFPL